MNDATEKRWTTLATDRLAGRTIQTATYMTREEAEAIGFHSRPLVLVLDDGSVLYPQSDDEGNDGGAMYHATAADDAILPVL